MSRTVTTLVALVIVLAATCAALVVAVVGQPFRVEVVPTTRPIPTPSLVISVPETP